MMEMEKKKIWKWIWIPIATALVITAGAFVLAWAMKTDQVSLTNQIAQKPSQTIRTPQTSATPQPSAPNAEERFTRPGPSLWSPPAEAVALRDSIYDLYQVQGTPEPGDKDITYRQAGVLAAKAFESTFREDLIMGGAQLYIKYNEYTGMRNGLYVITLYKKGWLAASYSCAIDAVNSHFVALGRLTELGTYKPDPSPTFTMNGMINAGDYKLDGMMNAAAYDPQVKERAAGIVKDNFLYGRTIKEVQIDGVAAAYCTAYDVAVDCYVHMSEGECYCIHIAYPTYEVISIDFIPIWPFDEGAFPDETANN